MNYQKTIIECSKVDSFDCCLDRLLSFRLLSSWPPLFVLRLIITSYQIMVRNKIVSPELINNRIQ